jgi:hypothetical protein
MFTKDSHLPLHKVVYFGVLLTLLVSAALPGVAFADSPSKETFFICPSVSTHNVNGKWVIGAHGAYYVLVPTKGGTNNDSKVYLTIPVSVPNLAQIPAGWALYHDLPFYPNFEGTAILLEEGISTWLGSPSGWEEFDMALVVNNGDGTYTVTNLTRGESVTISQPIPMASAAAW